MQISSRFTIALHIFACVETFKNEHKVRLKYSKTADFTLVEQPTKNENEHKRIRNKNK